MKKGVAALLGFVVVTASLRASVIERFTPDELISRSDAVVEGRVLEVHSQWNRDRTGLETIVRIAVDATLAGVTPDVVTIVQPGGVLDGNQHVVVGMPQFAEGEETRVYLRAIDGPGPEPRYRVFGWEQGKWSRVAGTWVPGALAKGSTSPFATNGMHWPAAKVPVQYKVHSAASDDLALDEIRPAIAAGFAAWDEVPCSSLAFQYAGETTLGVVVDQENVILFMESGWIYGDEAAGATSLWIPVEGEQTADIALNGEFFLWDIDPPGAVGQSVMDLQGVLTHEMGHFAGLGHTQVAHDTMYYSWKPWPGQRTLSADDKRGLCSIYPVAGDECVSMTDCPADETCETYEHGKLCTGTPAPVGTPCNYDVVECDAFCLFTATNLSTGYCSRFCESNDECPVTHHCDNASANGSTVKVCFVGAQPPRDAGVTDAAQPPDAAEAPDAFVPDASSGCGLCRRGNYCDEVAQQCTFDCRKNEDCGGGSFCNELGRCEKEAAEGCACSAGNMGAPATLTVLLLFFARRRSQR